MRFFLLTIAAGVLFGLCSADLPDQEVPNTLGMQTKDQSAHTEDIEGIKNVGAKFIRKGVYWTRVEPLKGVYDFSYYDRLIQDAEDRGLYVLGTLYGGNSLYENDGLGGIQTEEGRQGFAAFGAALADRYKGRNVIWEIWNEPNVRTFWNKEGMHNSDEFADEYTSLVKATAGAMVQADPECFVVAGSVSNFWEPSYYWTNACFERGIGESGIRGWSVHPYGLKTPEEYVVGYRRTREIFVNNNIAYDFPILNSERGFSLEKLDEGWSGGDAAKAEEYQAWHFVRQYMVDLLYDIRLSVWYEWDAEKFGIIYGSDERAAYHACTNMVKELGGYTFKERLYTISPNDYLLLFENASGKQKMVVWTAPPAGSSPDQYVPHTVEVPQLLKNKVEVRDIYGKETYFQIKNGKINIELTGSPKYITYIEPSHNGALSAIIWPDAPQIILSDPDWKQDTIPGFEAGTLKYTIVMPEGIDEVPSLYGVAQDENAIVSVINAKTLNGPLADRTSTIKVTAEDDTTTRNYMVEFKKEFPQPVVWSYHYLINNDSLLITGIPSGTDVESFLQNLLADSSNYVYNVVSAVDGSEKVASDFLSEGDTLRVHTADLSGLTDYILYVSISGPDNNAVLSSSIYSIDIHGTEGVISGFPFGTAIKSILDSVDVPETATLSVINDKNEAVPLSMLNFDTTYVAVQVNSNIYFKVTAQDMQTVINYQLQPEASSGDIFIYSNVLTVNQPSEIIASIPDGMSISTFLLKLWASEDGSIKVMDEYGNERLREAVSSDYQVVVSDKSGTKKKTYKLQMLSEEDGIYAYVRSDIFTVDQEGMYIFGISDTLEIQEFMDAVYPALHANLKILDADGNVKESGTVTPVEDILEVTSGNGEVTVSYKLYTTALYPVTIIIEDGTNPAGGAELIINNDTLTANQSGIIDLMLPNGEYEYYASKEDFSGRGSVKVSDTARTVNIVIKRVTYPLNIIVTEGSDPVSGAIVFVDGRYYMTDAEGKVTIDLNNGEYLYTVTAGGHDDQSGYVTIADSGQEINIIYESVSVRKETLHEANVYPNPSGGEFFISIPGENTSMEVEIYDITGKITHHQILDSSANNSIKLLNANPGLYFIQIRTGKSIINKKIIIK